MMALTVYDLWKNYKDKLESKVSVSGWVRTLRTSKSFGFIELNDGTHFKNIQIVFDENIPNFDELSKISTGSSLNVNGKLIQSPGDKQPFEISAESIEIFGLCDQDFPLQKKRHSVEYLRTIAHLRPRTNLFR
ncbi:MAG: asparagine--tRNA ligase, partial [Candidatus Delongbacteria bacterium]|nr:asparagine--tRNA ligase [Candidatus Delongbacteria bacterium]MCG2761263.1 OB-fold nucleic acid binding domain-containing protein [Candidatus Delongbacteria bacterium]